jgi:hypothetical protein
MSKWFIVLPPAGGARQVAQNAVHAFSKVLPSSDFKVFDSLTYQNAFTKLLKEPLEEMVMDLCNHAIAVQCFDFDATHLLVPALAPVTVFTLNLLRKKHVTTIHWFFEDFKRAVYWQDTIPYYDYFLAIQKDPIPDACKKAGTTYHFLPTAATPGCEEAYLTERPKTIDCAFIGIPTPYRIAMLEFLAANNITLAIGGLGWSKYQGSLKPCIKAGDWIEGRAASDILWSAKIGLNLSAIDPEIDRMSTHISPRVFDIIAHGLALVTEDVPLIRDTLPDIAYHTFTRKEDALSRIKQILTEMDKESGTLISNAQAVAKNHTYLKRVEEIIAITKPR